MGGDVHEMYKARANKHRKAITFKLGDLVWLHLREDRFPSRRKNKLMPKGDGPFKVLEKVNDNAYKLELPGDMGVSLTFNVGDLTLYLDDEEDCDDLRAITIKKGRMKQVSCPLKSKRAPTSSLVLTSSIKWDLPMCCFGASIPTLS